MLSQCWVTRGDIFLAGVSHHPPEAVYRTGVVLMPGFSQSMCDADFFMSRLARRLAYEGFYVLQLDPYGHGESPGCLEEVTMDSLRLDIQCAVDYAALQSGGRVVCIGKGLTASLMSEEQANEKVLGVAGINPYCLQPSEVRKLFQNLVPGVTDMADILKGTDFKLLSDFDKDLMAFFELLGYGLPHNLMGQRVSKKIFDELMEYEPYKMLTACSEAKYWLVSDKNINGGMRRWIPKEALLYSSLQEFMENYTAPDPMWYHNAIERLCGWIKQKGSECDANTGSNLR